MTSESLEFGKLATTVAIKVILGAREKVLSGKQLTSDELKYVGNSIGWFAVVTSGQGEYDVFAKLNKLCDDVISESKEGVDSQVSKLPARPPSIMAGGAGKKDQPAEGKVSGNPVLLQLIMGAIAIIFSGNTAYTVYTKSANKDAVIKQAFEQIDSNCAPDVRRGVAPDTSWWPTAEEQNALDDYNRRADVCKGVMAIQDANIKNARGQLSRAYSNVPKAVGAVVTAASMISMGPGAATPPGLAASLTAGGAAAQLIESMRASGGVPSDAIPGLVNGISQGFTSTAPATPSTAPATPSTAPATPAAGPAFTLPPTGGRRTRIKKTKKRSTKKFKKTRRGIRKPLFKY